MSGVLIAVGILGLVAVLFVGMLYDVAALCETLRREDELDALWADDEHEVAA